MYHAFNPTEMEILAGYIWGCQHVERPVRGKNERDEVVILRKELVPLPANVGDFDLSRPYTMLERFLEAVKVFVTVKNVKFENCKYHANNNTIEAIGNMDSKRQAASQSLFEAIKNCDEEVLKKMWEKHKNILTTGKLGFAPASFKPLVVEHTVSELENLASEKNPLDETVADGLTFEEPKVAVGAVAQTITEPIVSNSSSSPEKRKPGRPKKEA